MSINNTPKVSIIVPIFNVEKYIRKCVCSLFEQTYSNVEYIFVNDCTQDNSINILNSLIQEYRKNNVLIVNHEINKGLPSARNTGLHYATGDYIYHCDSDDWVDKSIIEFLIKEAVKNDADICFCDFYNVIDDKLSLFKQEKHDSLQGYLKSFFTGKSQAAVWNKIIKHSLYKDNQIVFPDGKPMLEDMRTIIPLFYYAQNIAYVPKPLYYYVRLRANSITSSNLNSINVLRQDRVENVRDIDEFLNKKNINGINNELNILKLMAKKSLLLTADSVTALKKWEEIFPEANISMKNSDFPWYYKLLYNEINHQRWLIPNIWIQLKRIKNRYFHN